MIDTVNRVKTASISLFCGEVVPHRRPGWVATPLALSFSSLIIVHKPWLVPIAPDYLPKFVFDLHFGARPGSFAATAASAQ